MRRRVGGTALCVALAAFTSSFPANGVSLQLPDLVPLAPSHIVIDEADAGTSLDGAPALRFSVGVANRGNYAFDLLGIPEGFDPSGEPSSRAMQCVEWIDPPGVCSERSDVGRIVFHTGHAHWHLVGFVLYELRRLDGDGDVIPGPTGLAAASAKVSFCLQNVDRDEASPPSEVPAVNVYSLCNAGMQGLSPGWVDVYSWDLIGQQIVLDGVGDGPYAIVITVDPDRKFHETSSQNNEAIAKIRIEDGVATPM